MEADRFAPSTEKLLNISRELQNMLDTEGSATDFSDHFRNWLRTCRSIERQATDDVLRVAVVGPIKSGKSTLVNALLSGDYLKRGAGVVTSIVTKVRRGPKLKATLLFKSWRDINIEMEQAMILFPFPILGEKENAAFDIRERSHREHVQSALDKLNREMLVSVDTRNINSVLLEAYLKGFDRIKDLVSTETREEIYDGDAFDRHKPFVSDESLSVYLKDVRIEIVETKMPDSVEIADCQGSDSPNPLHLAMIQDYLLSAHLLVYVVSSRTGLRQADIRFLNIIGKMGILETTIFVLNCDISEHESLEDLQALSARVASEISLIKSDPLIFNFSALLKLFRVQKAHLSQKDINRLAQWEQESEIISLLDADERRFEDWFYRKLEQDRSVLLLKNHLERLNVINSDLHNWAKINWEVLTKDVAAASRITDKLRAHQARIQQIKTMTRSTLSGAANRIRKDLKADVDRFFDLRRGDSAGVLIRHIRSYTIRMEEYEKNVQSAGFMSTLYLIFQDFKQSTDAVMAESVHPELIRFIKQEESRIAETLLSMAQPFEQLVSDALSEYRESLAGFDITVSKTGKTEEIGTDLSSVPKAMGLEIPQAAAGLRYSAHVKTEAVLRLGAYRILRVLKRIFRKSLAREDDTSAVALNHGVARMKKEMEKAVEAFFKDYRENIKFQYLFKVVDGMSSRLYDALVERFAAYDYDVDEMVHAVDNRGIDRHEVERFLNDLMSKSREIGNRIEAFRSEITKEGAS